MNRSPLIASIAAAVLLCAPPAAGAAAGSSRATAPPPPAPGSLPVAAPGAPRYAAGEVLVRFRPAARAAQRAASLAAARATVLQQYPIAGIVRLKLDSLSVEDAVARLSKDPQVLYAEPNWVVTVDRTPDDPFFPDQWPLANRGQTQGTPGADIRAEYAWDVTTGDSTLVVGVIDSGVDYHHPDLAANVWTNPGEIPGNGIDDDGDGYVDDVHGWDFANGDSDPWDDNGHGTHVAGTIAAVSDNGYGVAGVCWHAKIMALKFINAAGSGFISNAIAAIEFAARHHVRITNNSWSGGPYSQALVDVITAAGADGMLFVAAAGNSGSDLDVTPAYPAAYPVPEILSVAATDKNDSLAAFSNYGQQAVDLAAPGVSVLSLWPDDRFALLSGTSMAAPHVTGAAALLLASHPGLGPLELKDRLMKAAIPLPTLAGRCVSGARLDLLRAVAEPDSVPPGAITDLSVTASGSNSLELAWTATGDDGDVGTAFAYDVRVATAPFDSAGFASASRLHVAAPGPAGTAEHARLLGLTPLTTYWVAVRAEDEFGNAGPISNLASGTTLVPPKLVLSGAPLAAALPTGGTAEVDVTITNDSQGTLDWRVPPAVLAPGAVPAPAPAAAASSPSTVKGAEGPRGAVQPLSAGGPDAFGYRWLDSAAPGGPVYDWIDIASPANRLELTGDDATTDPLPIGFDFPFYGGTYGQVRVCTNGFLTFGAGASDYANTTLPSPDAPARLVAALWDDLTFGFAGRRAYAWSDGARFVVTWEGVPRWAEPLSSLTFQAVLEPNGEIRCQYRSLAGDLASSTVGIQDGSRTVGLTVAANQPYLHDSLAVRFVPTPRWVWSEPDSGSLGPGGSETLRVHFDASRLGTTSLATALHVLTNDPAAPDTALTATLEVTGVPIARLHTASLAFGDVQAGRADTLHVLVENAGGTPLALASVQAPAPFAALFVPHVLQPGAFEALPVAFAPAVPGDDAGVLAIGTDDAAHPLLQAALSGRGVPPPAIALGGASLGFDAANGIGPLALERSASVVVRNTGLSPLHWSATALQTPPAPPASSPRPGAKGAAGPAGAVGPRGPDAAGYRWTDSDSPDGLPFAWEEVSEVGARVFGGADDSTRADVPLPFAFPFYGDTFTTVNVCTNGWLSFRDTTPVFANGDLPDTSSATPRDLVAPWWDDLDLRPVGGPAGAYAWYDGTKFVIEWKDAAHFAVGGPYTFEVLLWPDGSIDFQYLSMAGGTDQATIGLQDASGSVGLRVAWNAPYVHDRLRVRLAQRPPWLAVDRREGVTPAGGADTVRVLATADGWPDGDRAGAVRFASDDPQRPLADVPVTLHVGAAPASAALSPAALGPVSLAPLVEVDLVRPPGHANLDPATATLAGVPARSDVTGTPSPGHELAWFDAVALRAALAQGDTVALPFAGLMDGGWVADTILAAVARASFPAGPLAAFGAASAWPLSRAGVTIPLEWTRPADADRMDVMHSADGGRTWSLVGSTAEPMWPFVPADSSAANLIELVAMRGDSAVASWLSAPFATVLRPLPQVPADVPPPIFALRVFEATPGRLPVRMLWSLPVAARGRALVLDVRGARVRTLADGPLAAGNHLLVWDGRTGEGAAAAPGVYFVRAEAAGRALVRRVVLLR